KPRSRSARASAAAGSVGSRSARRSSSVLAHTSSGGSGTGRGRRRRRHATTTVTPRPRTVPPATSHATSEDGGGAGAGSGPVTPLAGSSAGGRSCELPAGLAAAEEGGLGGEVAPGCRDFDQVAAGRPRQRRHLPAGPLLRRTEGRAHRGRAGVHEPLLPRL